MVDSLGDRMKEFYEGRSQTCLLRRTHTLIRVDGKAFHSYTRGLKRPFDDEFISDMNQTAQTLCEEIQGAQLAFVQSDEISVLVTDFKKFETSGWFDNNVQKVVSVSASIATEAFNHARITRMINQGLDTQNILKAKRARFDSRVFQIPDSAEVANYFLWRQQDATRNSIQSTARANFSHSELNGKSQKEMQGMLLTQKNINWNDYPAGYKRGRVVMKMPSNIMINGVAVERMSWSVIEPPIFSQEPEFLGNFLSSLRDEMEV